MATAGELIWAGAINSMTGNQTFSSTTRPGTRCSVFIRIGRWTSYQSDSALLGTLRIKGVRLAVTRKMQPRVYLRLEKSTRDGGFMHLQRIPWEYVWARNPKTGALTCIFKDKNLLVLPVAYLRKFKKAFAASRSHSSRVVRNKPGEYRLSLTGAPNPKVVNKSIENFSEVYQELHPANSYGYRSDGLYTYQTHAKSWTSVRTPGYRFKRARELPVNNWSSNQHHTYDGRGISLRDFIKKSGWSSENGYIHVFAYTTSFGSFSPPAFETVHSDVSYNKALSRLIENCGLSLEANLAQDLAQFSQTTRLMANTMTRLTGSVTSLKRGNFAAAVGYLWAGSSYRSRKARKHLSFTKTLAENWLELQYGWKPLLQDIEGSIRSLKTFVANDPTIATGRGSAMHKTTAPITPILWGVGVGHGETVVKSRTKFGLRYTVDSRLKSLAAQTGFTNPINLAWEILPFSFVYDWFHPIGPFLEMFSAFDGLAFKDGFRTQYTTQEVFVGLNYSGDVQLALGHLRVGGSYLRRQDMVNRVKLSAFPSPRIPKLKSPLSVTHALNALALLRVAFSQSGNSFLRRIR